MPLVRIELTTPGLRDQCSTTELRRLLVITPFLCRVITLSLPINQSDTSSAVRQIQVARQPTLAGSVAEWSKALVLGASLSSRGFESHRCQI